MSTCTLLTGQSCQNLITTFVCLKLSLCLKEYCYGGNK